MACSIREHAARSCRRGGAELESTVLNQSSCDTGPPGRAALRISGFIVVSNSARSRRRSHAALELLDITAPVKESVLDFDGFGKSKLRVFRPSPARLRAALV